MRSLGLNRIAGIGILGVVFLGLSAAQADGQSRRDLEREQRRIARQQRQIIRDNERQQRERTRRTNPETNRGSVLGARVNSNHPAVRSGYDQGFQAGQYDRRKGKYNQSNVYRNSGGIYPIQGDPSSADYLYRQGYQQGYDDGFRGRY